MNNDIKRIREDFPILGREVNGKPLIYLDNAASTQKPQVVIEAIRDLYSNHYSNIHRGIHTLSTEATQLYEDVRIKAQSFINARHTKEIIFVRGTTEAINLVAQSYGHSALKAGDEILISEMEHHSNIVPWQLVCAQIGATLKVIPINDAGELQLDKFEALLNENTKLVAITHMSNALGTINPVKNIIDKAHQKNVPVLLDGAQAISHMAVDVQELDCDFYCFSGHKMYGPSGVGVLYGKSELLDQMPPYQGGGEMISKVSFEGTTFRELPFKFEAGTPNIAGVVGLGAAIDYINDIGIHNIASYEKELLNYMNESAMNISGLKLIGTAKQKASIFSFLLNDIHPHDIGTILDSEGIAIRSGHHCAMPLMHRLGISATARASLAFYNTREEIDQFMTNLQSVYKVMQNG